MSVANIPSTSAITPKPAPGVSTVRKDNAAEAKAPTAAASAAPKPAPAQAPANVPASPEANQAALAAAASSQKLDVTPSGFSTFKMSA